MIKVIVLNLITLHNLRGEFYSPMVVTYIVNRLINIFTCIKNELASL